MTTPLDVANTLAASFNGNFSRQADDTMYDAKNTSDLAQQFMETYAAGVKDLSAEEVALALSAYPSTRHNGLSDRLLKSDFGPGWEFDKNVLVVFHAKTGEMIVYH